MSLKAYTQYRCLSCRKFSRWTGALSTEQDHCPECGAELTEDIDDGRRWRVSYEMIHIGRGQDWSSVSRETASEHDARQQCKGLAVLIARGEQIRNVKLEVSAVAWEEVAP